MLVMLETVSMMNKILASYSKGACSGLNHQLIRTPVQSYLQYLTAIEVAKNTNRHECGKCRLKNDTIRNENIAQTTFVGQMKTFTTFVGQEMERNIESRRNKVENNTMDSFLSIISELKNEEEKFDFESKLNESNIIEVKGEKNKIDHLQCKDTRKRMGKRDKVRPIDSYDSALGKNVKTYTKDMILCGKNRKLVNLTKKTTGKINGEIDNSTKYLTKNSRNTGDSSKVSEESSKHDDDDDDDELPEEPTTCCMSGCANCVWIEYAEKLNEIFSGESDKAKRIILEKVKDPNMKAFLQMELNTLERKKKETEDNDDRKEKS